MYPYSQRQSGFSTMGFVIILAGIAGVVGGFNVLRSQSVLKASDARNASQEAGDMNFNALSVYQALASGPDPAIYPDPYLPVKDATMKVGSKAVPNALWDWTGDKVTIHSTSYHGKPQGNKTSTAIKPGKLAANDSARPLLITHADVKANTTVDLALNKTAKPINSSANLNLPPPPTPTCSIGVSGTPSTQPFTCLKIAAISKPSVDPITGTPVLDAAGKPVVITIPPVFGGCAGASAPWAFDTDEGQSVTMHFLGNGVVADASIVKQPGSAGTLDFAAGPIPKSSAVLPYPLANRVEGKNAQLRDITFIATNSAWVQLNVAGPDGSVGKCVAGLHVNHGPAKNTEGDSWAGDARVQMADGSFKKIEAVKAGEEIWNPKLQKAQQVLYMHKTMPNSSMVRLEIGDETLSVTSHHPFLTKRGLLQAKDLRPGDELPGAAEKWKSVTARTVYRPGPDLFVYDIFLNADISSLDKMINVQGLQVPSYEWQQLLSSIPEESATALDFGGLPLSIDRL